MDAKVYIGALNATFPLIRLTDSGKAVFLKDGKKLVAPAGSWAYRA